MAKRQEQATDETLGELIHHHDMLALDNRVKYAEYGRARTAQQKHIKSKYKAEAAKHTRWAKELRHLRADKRTMLELVLQEGAHVRRSHARLCVAVKKAAGFKHWPQHDGKFVDYVCGVIAQLGKGKVRRGR